jgi:hypothetical protein
MTGTATNAAELQHPIGSSGRFALRLPSGSVSVRAVDGTVATVRDLSGQRLADRFRISSGDDFLELATRNRLGVSISIGSLELGGGQAELAVEVPRGTRVAIDGASADISVTGVMGPGRYRTASGDLILQDVGGNLDVEAVSADLRIEAAGPIELVGRTISGDAVIRAPRLSRFEFNTTSGDIRVDADLAGKGPFSVRSISGDVTFVARGALEIEAQTVTGELTSDLQHRSESGPGRRVMWVGKGGASVTFKSVSGDLRVVEPRDSAPSAVLAPGVAAAKDTGPAGSDATAAAMPEFARESRDEPGPSSPELEAARLAILRDLERGAIDVETATERLMVVEQA